MANIGTSAPATGAVTEPPIPVQKIPHLQLPTSTSTDSAIAPTTSPQSKKEKRKQKKDCHDSAITTPCTTDTESSSPRTPPKNPPRKRSPKKSDSLGISPSMPLAKNAAQTAYPLLICSIGNPGSTYANTLHSAGHILTKYLSERRGYKPFTKGLTGLVSRPSSTTLAFGFSGFRRTKSEGPAPELDWTFWQSTSLMNVSGANVKRAYGEWLKGVKAASGATTEGRLVVIHDELESALGKVTVKDGGASAKGHNGLKSCQQQLEGVKWWRVGVGIGRPESRDPSVVSNYVLSKISGKERAALEGSAVQVFGALEDIAGGNR